MLKIWRIIYLLPIDVIFGCIFSYNAGNRNGPEKNIVSGSAHYELIEK